MTTTFNHRLAAAFLALFTVGYFGSGFLVSALGWSGLPGALLWTAFWALAFIVACFVAMDALLRGSATHTSNLAALVDRVAPLAALLVGGGTIYLGSAWLMLHDRLQFAEMHSTDLSGPPPQAVIYSRGIPDGGTAIVRLPGRNPQSLPQATMIRLSGERFRRCSQLDDRDWFCWFD